ncbi:hypothetical protein ScPMuIL_009484, partial [Solemya velum]
YVSDPERWRVFYEDLLGGKIDTKQYRPNQKGGRRKPYVIPVSRITPMKAVENRAKVELREAVREGEPHVPLQKTIKGTDYAIPDALLVFKEPANQVAVQKVYFSECRPVSSYHTDGTPVEIFVPNQGNEYLDLKRSRLYVKARIVKADGSALVPQEKTGIINLPLQSLWSQVDVYANGKLISLHGSHYPWKAYLKTILYRSKNVTETQLKSQLFVKDDGAFDDPDAFGGTNRGLAARYRLTKQSRTFDMEGPLYEDVFGLEKYLVNGVDLQLKFFRNPSSFLLMSEEDAPSYKIELLDVTFKACMIKIDEGLLLNHSRVFEDRTAKYPLTRTEIKMNTIPSGSGSFIWQN